jgi:hypothetical protein
MNACENIKIFAAWSHSSVVIPSSVNSIASSSERITLLRSLRRGDDVNHFISESNHGDKYMYIAD